MPRPLFFLDLIRLKGYCDSFGSSQCPYREFFEVPFGFAAALQLMAKSENDKAIRIRVQLRTTDLRVVPQNLLETARIGLADRDLRLQES